MEDTLSESLSDISSLSSDSESELSDDGELSEDTELRENPEIKSEVVGKVKSEIIPEFLEDDIITPDDLMEVIVSGSTEALEKLLVKGGPKFRNDLLVNSFKNACASGQNKSVKMFLDVGKVDPSIDDNFAMRMACRKENFELLGTLLEKGVDPSYASNDAIRTFIKKNNFKGVKILLKDSRTKFWDCDSEAISECIKKNYYDMFVFLFKLYPRDPIFYVHINSLLITAFEERKANFLAAVLKDYRSDPNAITPGMMKAAEQQRLSKILMIIKNAKEKHKIYNNPDTTPKEKFHKLLEKKLFDFGGNNVSYDFVLEEGSNQKKLIMTIDL